MTAPTLTISRLATAGGVHVETVRYYQRRRLLPEPERPQGGIRRYSSDDVNRLQFIRRAQVIGFSLEEIAGLLAVKGSHACEETRLLTERKLTEVRQRMVELQQLESELEHLVAACCDVNAGERCPTLDHLGQQASS
ncbi:MAG: MerR family DNA-binding protein [Proteobacteria bacterium]|nr:MerR family DNA-binding protein [Pseudomonadota bacterium]